MSTEKTEDTEDLLKDSGSARGVNLGADEGSVDDTLPAPEFTTFIYSLSTTALMQMGEIDNPETNKKDKNYQLAKHTIDLLDMLKEKTKNNLTEEESKLMEGVLYDLRTCYCKIVG
ncbi:hypothetical protein MNBD_DELTA02-818 [hydrothermal vent metagenome]|uniref:DUF1844 domain-containing protein n=1 Tax=hydrothermal vent metagenome TaxID=652676 RepID=A0A3B0VE77_9ZZZZ